jgi:hypothetical protein
VSWRRHLTPQEKAQIARYDRALKATEARARVVRMLRRLIQNRAYQRGKSK